MLDIRDFNVDNLPALLFEANKQQTPIDVISQSKSDHIDFLKEYLGSTRGLNANYILFEDNYISKDYTTDYSFYYSTSYTEYRKKSTRIHFFSYTQKDIIFKNYLESVLLLGKDHPLYKNFWDNHYLGFIVINPLPYTFIGYTLLKHYKEKDDKVEEQKGEETTTKERKYWGVKPYTIHIYGNEVKLTSLAFKEQDRNVSACATISIWVMLQMAAEDYHIILKSPSEITKDTGIVGFGGQRLFPNKGLDIIQICNAITKNGLVTDLVKIENNINPNKLIKKLVNAYSKIKIPLILAITVKEKNSEPVGHAVTICGHGIEKNKKNKRIFSLCNKKEDEIKIICENINKLYVHDDQWGPFARYNITEDSIQTPWSFHGNTGIIVKPTYLIIPTFPKIKIPYEDIEFIISYITIVIEDIFKNIINNFVEWDIQLYYSEDFKSEIKDILDTNNPIDQKYILSFLSTSLPKFIWVAKMHINNSLVSAFIFDATAIVKSNVLITVLTFHPTIQDQIVTSLVASKNHITFLEKFLMIDIDTFITKFEQYKFN